MATDISNTTHSLADIIAALSEKLQRSGSSAESALDDATSAVNTQLAAAVLANTPDYEQTFQAKTTDLVMGHIDRMNDVCPEDAAEAIIKSFTDRFGPILQTYFDAKFPQRAAEQAAMELRRAAHSSTPHTNTPSVGRARQAPRRRNPPAA